MAQLEVFFSADYLRLSVSYEPSSLFRHSVLL